MKVTINPAHGLDFIGDIHGHHGVLVRLLGKLGYESAGEGFQHPAGRKAVFLGDYIDRGPAIRATLQTVRAMTDAGDAFAIAGNHEWNALNYHRRGADGEWLRPRGGRQTKQHQATMTEFTGLEAEWQEWLAWFAALPVYLDFGAVRCVHAAWDPQALAVMAGQSLADAAFLEACARKGTPAYEAANRLMKGVELRLPEGVVFEDKEGVKRKEARVRWWLNSLENTTWRGLTFPDNRLMPDILTGLTVHPGIPGYPATEPPCFLGHYWLPPDIEPQPLTPNLACLDYSVARGGFLTAYRWNGEAELSAEQFVQEPAA